MATIETELPKVPTAIETEPHPYLWTLEEYERMTDIGFFNHKRVQLIEGVIIEMASMKSPHSASVTLTNDALRTVFKERFYVQSQVPISLGKRSQPEPDVAVIVGKVRDYAKAHPTNAALVVEVSDATLAYDRRVKGSLYARYGIEDYWVVNLIERKLEIYRRPTPDESQPSGFRYADVVILDETESVSPLAAPDAMIKVADLLP